MPLPFNSVDEADVEEEIRNRILSEAVTADVVMVVLEEEEIPRTLRSDGDGKVDDNKSPRRRRMMATCMVTAAILIVVVVVVVVVSRKENGSGDEKDAAGKEEDVFDPKAQPTVEPIKESGYVLCGIEGDNLGVSHINPETGIMEGMNIDHVIGFAAVQMCVNAPVCCSYFFLSKYCKCRALSIAVFGTPDNIEPVPVLSKTRFRQLVDGEIDVLTNTVTRTMGRGVYEPSAKTGLAFSTPFLYSGLLFGEYVECADKLDSLFGDCRSLKICVTAGTRHERIIDELMPGGFNVSLDTLDDMFVYFLDDKCHAIASEPPNLPDLRIRELGYNGPFTNGVNMLSREPLCLVTRQDDPAWTNLVNLIVNTSYMAEANQISKTNANDLLDLLPLPLPQLATNQAAGNWDESFATTNTTTIATTMVAIIEEFGNYGDLYQKHLKDIWPRSGLNLMYYHHHHHRKDPASSSSSSSSGGGLLYSFPFGLTDTNGPDPTPESMMGKILERGHVRCLVAADAVAVADAAVSLHEEICRAVAAAVFAGDKEAVIFVEPNN